MYFLPSDIDLEYEDSDTYRHFEEFYEDVLPEFKQAGDVIQFKVCRNYEPHLKGNVYVQYGRYGLVITRITFSPTTIYSSIFHYFPLSYIPRLEKY